MTLLPEDNTKPIESTAPQLTKPILTFLVCRFPSSSHYPWDLLIPKTNTTIKWRNGALIEHDGEYAPSGYVGCKHTEFLNLPKGVESKAQTSLGNAVPWRKAALIEHQGEYRRYGDYGCTNADYLCSCRPSCVCEDAINNTYSCIRTLSEGHNYIYCTFEDDENFQEFYNFTSDPHQLTNIINKMTPEFLADQNKQLVKLSLCKGASCRQVHPPEEEERDENNVMEDHSSNFAKSAKQNGILESNSVVSL
ncbi:uncharacterized protein [Amphiura filiformis]|uniref:uncharacterized protein n=1 Tax=Amphiura filiformis TaxID=82378 RepID=UPI003B216626